MVAISILTTLLLATPLLAAQGAAQVSGPALQATLIPGADAAMALKVINPGPRDIVLISPDHPDFVSDGEACSVLVTSVVTREGLEFDFTPTTVRVEAGRTWDIVVKIRSTASVLKKCKSVTYQVNLAYLLSEGGAPPKLTREYVFRNQRFLVSEKLHG